MGTAFCPWGLELFFVVEKDRWAIDDPWTWGCLFVGFLGCCKTANLHFHQTTTTTTTTTTTSKELLLWFTQKTVITRPPWKFPEPRLDREVRTPDPVWCRVCRREGTWCVGNSTFNLVVNCKAIKMYPKNSGWGKYYHSVFCPADPAEL